MTIITIFKTNLYQPMKLKHLYRENPLLTVKKFKNMCQHNKADKLKNRTPELN